MDNKKVVDVITIENATIGFRNFSGKENQFNPKGTKSFCVFLDEDFATRLQKDRWNVKWPKDPRPDDTRKPYLPVGVNFDNFPPKVVIIKNDKKSELNDEDIHILDWVEIKNVDIIIRPYNWSNNGKAGVKAYLKTMYITVVQDAFEAKYESVPDISSPSDDHYPDLPF